MATFLKTFIVVLLAVLLVHAFVSWQRPDTPGLSFLPGDIAYQSPGGNAERLVARSSAAAFNS
jgi:hypothetical protein